MSDHFAALGEPRRPWLEPESLKEKFHVLSATVHPDRVHEADEAVRQSAAQRYTELNAAYQCLREPKARLRHLIVLERGTKPGDSHEIPDDLLRLFSDIGRLLRQANELIGERKRTTSPVVKVQLMQEALPCLEDIDHVRSHLQDRRGQLDSALAQLDAEWRTADREGASREGLLLRAEQLYHLYGFIDRWLAQLQEKAFQLTL